MRVLQVINSLEVAGAEVMLGDLAPRLAERGLSVSVAVFRRFHSRLERALEDVSVEIHYVRGGGPQSPAKALGLASLCRTADIVHSHLYPAQLWTAIAARLGGSRARLLTTEHNPDNNRRGKTLWAPIDRWMYTAYDAIACNSQATADALHRWIPETQVLTEVIPNGIAIDRFASNQPRRSSLGSPPIAISVARLEPQKDHATLFLALTRVPGLHLWVVGDGTLRPQLEKLASDLKIADRVEFFGLRNDVPDLLRRADIYVHSTHSDGFGISAVEAMAAGVPVVASAVPGLDWVVGDAGLTCRPGDADELGAAMARLLADANLRAELASRGSRRARLFTVEAMVDSYARLYDRLMESPQAAMAARG